MSVEVLGELRSERGRALLAEATARGVRDEQLLATSSALRTAGYDADLIAGALTTVRLRERTADRLGPWAARMFFTPDGAEQATRLSVADRRAVRFAEAGVRHVTDLCCGIGADALAFARAGLAVEAVDLDPLSAAVAEANAAELGLADRVAVTTGEGTEVPIKDAAFCDPARRRGGRRVFDPAAYSPPFSFVTELLGRVAYAGAKVAPGIDHHLIPAGVEAEWVGDRGTVVEAALWSPAFAIASRRATVLPAGESLTGDGDRTAAVGPVRGWLYEPDGAVVRAHLVAELADRLGATLVDERIAYLTGDEPVSTPFAHRYRIEESMPFSLKRLRAALRARDVGPVTILKRGSAVDVDELRRGLKLTGSAAAVVALTRIGSRPYALICSPPDKAPV